MLVLPGAVRAAGGKAVDRQQCAVQDHERRNASGCVWNTRACTGHSRRHSPARVCSTAVGSPASGCSASLWITRRPDTLTDSHRERLDRILDTRPGLATARELRGHDLTHWLARALDQGPQPIQGFAAFLQNDWDSVVDGLTLHWSSGAGEGEVTRIRLIKRRSYGRASFAPLRTLVLARPP
ncbi:transposase [Streptomyces hydrogenans]